MAETNQKKQNTAPEQDTNSLRQIRIDKLHAMQEAGNDPFQVMTANQTVKSMEIKNNYEDFEDKEGSICGRMIARRIMGKASFAQIQDREGNIQIYVSRDDLGVDDYQAFKKAWDIGDILEVTGKVFKTKTGEISVHATAAKLLSKSLLPLPEKFHGLKDADTRYRQRYVDLIVNPDVKDTFIKRSKIITSVRKTMDDAGYIEVETPVLNTIAGGAAARPFITHHNALDIDMYMRIATELPLKRLIVGGMERVYEIGRIFRNEGMDAKHNPEFTTIEFYEAYTDYNGMMDRTEAIFRNAALAANGTTKLTYKGVEMDLAEPFERLTMAEAVKKYTGIDFEEFACDREKALEVAKEKNVEVEKGKDSWGEILVAFYDAFVEENLQKPTFIIDYPVEVSVLTKRNPSKPYLTERFELFICGAEFAIPLVNDGKNMDATADYRSIFTCVDAESMEVRWQVLIDGNCDLVATSYDGKLAATNQYNTENGVHYEDMMSAERDACLFFNIARIEEAVKAGKFKTYAGSKVPVVDGTKASNPDPKTSLVCYVPVSKTRTV